LNRVRPISCLLAALAAAASAIGCGGGTTDGVVVRIGGDIITKTTVVHWMAVMAPDHIVPDPPHYRACIAHQKERQPQTILAVVREECGDLYRQMQKEALDYLIALQWRAELARELGLRPSKLQATDANFAPQAELESARLQRAVTSRAPRVTSAQIADYYRQHARRYRHPERRYIEIVEGLPSRAAASRAMSRVTPGAALASPVLHESVDKTRAAETPAWKRSLDRTIFAAKQHVLVGPHLFLKRWYFFRVNRVVPEVIEPLQKVRGTIAQKLADEYRRHTLAASIKAWRQKWRSRTDCRPGWVVQKCRQYVGERAQEEPFVFN
jgi:hypothetical protein